MKRFSFFLLAAGIIAASLSLNSCQKDNLQVANPSNPNVSAGDRAPLIYGVSVFSAGNPSQLFTLDLGTGAIQGSVQVFFNNSTGQQIFVDDLKGVCVVGGQVWVTTGFNVVDAYSNLLLKVDPTTGQGGIISHSTVGTVSDIDYDENSNTVYGLLNNGNRLVTINDNSNNWGTYVVQGNITNLGANYVAKGLSMARDGGGVRIIVAATQANAGNANVYSVPATAGAANLLSTINPANQLATGHCGIGFEIDINAMLINRRANAGFGINSFAWANPLANPTASAFWGGNGVNFEDLSSRL